MTPDEIINKWIGIGLFDDEPIVTQVEADIIAGLRADIQQAITAAVEAERDACAKIAYAQYASIQETAPSGRHPGQGKRECCADRCIVIRDRIRARSNASARSASPAAITTDVEAL